MNSKYIVYSLYLFLSLQLISFIDISFFNLSALTVLKYPILFLNTFVVLVYTYIHNTGIIKNSNNIMVLLLLLLIILPGSFFSMEIEQSTLRAILALIFFAYIYGLISILSSEQLIKIVFHFFFYISIITIIVTNYYLFTGNSKIFYFGNLKSFFSNANSLGALISLYMIPSIFNKLSISSKKYYIVYYVMILNLFIFLWLIRSRSALLSFFILLSFFLFYKHVYLNKKAFINKIYLSIGILFLFFIVTVNQEYFTKYLIKYEHIKSSNLAQTRLSLWNDRVHAISVYPYFGWGYGINSQDYIQVKKDWQYIQGETEKGNTILSILEEFGFIIGIPIILIISYLMIYNLRIIKYFLYHDYIVISISILVAGLIHINFESWLLYFGNINSFLFWILFISILNLKTNTRIKHEH